MHNPFESLKVCKNCKRYYVTKAYSDVCSLCEEKEKDMELQNRINDSIEMNGEVV